MHLANTGNSWLISLTKLHDDGCSLSNIGYGVLRLDYTNHWPVLLVEETGVPVENRRPAASYWQISSHNFVSSTPCLSWIRTHNVYGDMDWLHR
jgi:hypothetical protein